MAQFRRISLDILLSPYFQASMVFVGFLLVAWIINRYLHDYFERFVEGTDTQIDDYAYAEAEHPLVWTVRLLGIYLAVSLVWLPGEVEFVSKGVIVTAIVGFWTHWLWKVVDDAQDKVEDNYDLVEDQITQLGQNVARAAALAIAAYFFFLAWDINLTAWLASAGVLGIAVGFAARDMLSNLFAGIFILTDQPYTTGDFIRLSSGKRGRVEHIGLRSTEISTPDHIQVTIPNSEIANAEIINESSGPEDATDIERRITTTVGVDYGTDLDAVTASIESAVESVDTINADRPVDVQLHAFGEESLILRVACRLTDPEHHDQCIDQLNRAIYDTLDSESVLGPPM